MANSRFFMRCLGSPRRLVAALHKQAARLFSRRRVARALLRQGFDCATFHQYLDSNVRQSIQIQEPREDAGVRERRPGSRTPATSTTEAALFASPPAVTLSFPRQSDNWHASLCTAHLALIIQHRGAVECRTSGLLPVQCKSCQNAA